jgi:uncharacterized membrane protein
MDSQEPVVPRLHAVDALRGLVMIIMALDHVRDFFHVGAMSFSPEDLTKTTPLLFFTRWITHFCAPVFMFTAGIGAFLWWQKSGRTKKDLSRFLFTRGLWLVLLEVTVMRLAYNFSLSAGYPVLLIVLWVLGACMIVLAALVYLPLRALAVLSAAVILLHNCLDPFKAAQFGIAAPLWSIMHQPGAFFIAGAMVIVAYPLIPWAAVMAGGFCFGRIFLLDQASRKRILLRTGLACILAFILLRGLNLYGDPSPWSAQSSPLFTLMSFLRCTKYPPSLDYLLMTLGPALLVLSWFDGKRFSPANPLIVLGRVPLFFFIAHFYAIHFLMDVLGLLRYGRIAFPFLFHPPPSFGGPSRDFPPDFGYPLWVVYAVWILIVASLYPICRWFAHLKSTRRSVWLSYL